MLTPIALPPGVFRNGTELQSAGRWYDANMVRWYEGVMRPIGGWRIKSTTAITGLARSAITWQDNAGDAWTAAGTAAKLYVMRADGALSDITPVGLTEGFADETSLVGYGNSFYGSGTYGTPRLETSAPTPATTWSLDTWGEYLVACSNADGKIYEWVLDFLPNATGSMDLDFAGGTYSQVDAPTYRAQEITNAPTGCAAILVTSERILMALGAGGNYRKVQWSDQEDNTDWTPTTLNQAGDFELTTTGQLMAGKRVRGTHLLFTSQDVHSATYIGQPFVYSFEKVGAGCGLIGAMAVTTASSTAAYWMSNSGFWVFDGAVRPLQCDVGEYVFRNMNAAQTSKVSAVHIDKYSEIWWLYPSANSTEVDSYVVYNYRENHWTIGTLARTSGAPAGGLRNPIMIGTDGYVYEHETGLDKNGASVYAESGPVQIGAGEQTMVVRQLVPDEKTQGDVNVSFSSRFYPNAAESTFGPYSTANPTSVRFSGRQVQMKIEQATLSDWRVGTMRLDLVPNGKR